MDSYLQYQNAISDTLQAQQLASAKASIDSNKRLEQAKEVVEPITGSFIKEAIKPTIISAGKVLGRAGISGAEDFAKEVSEKGLAQTLGDRLNDAVASGTQAVRDTMSNVKELNNIRIGRGLKLANPNASEEQIAKSIKTMNDPKEFAEKFRASRPDKAELSDEDIEKFRQYKVNKLLKKGTIADDEEQEIGNIVGRGKNAVSSASNAFEETKIQPGYRVLADVSRRARAAEELPVEENIPRIASVSRPEIQELGEIAEQQQQRLIEPQLTRLEQLKQLPQKIQQPTEEVAKQVSKPTEEVGEEAAEEVGKDVGKQVAKEAGEEVGEEAGEEAATLGAADLLGPIGLIAGIGITTALALAHKKHHHIQTPAPISTQFGL